MSDWGVGPCARCGASPLEGGSLGGMIGDEHYCHGDTKPSCYELASWERPPDLGAWRRAAGIARPLPGSPPPEATIRKMRDED